MARIENHKYTINEAFQECFYIVPNYQREYIWTEKQVNQLLEDINEQIDVSSSESGSSEYFIGTVLVSPTSDKKHFDIIDGQQRLTTMFLILCALRALFKRMPEHVEMISKLIATSYADSQGEIRRNLKLEPCYENAGDVIKRLVQTDGDPKAVRANIQSAGIPIHGSASVENILAAYEAIYRYLTDNYDDEAKLKKYWGHLNHNVVFIQISTDVSNALKIFETVNERGIGLNPMDLLKNLLFTQVSPDLFSQLKDEWKKITSPLEKAGEKPLRFLRYFLMANYVIKDKNATVREDEIYDWFSKQENATITEYQKHPFEFVKKITQNVNRYIDFVNGLGNDGKRNLAMDSLKELTGKAFSLHCVLLLAAANLPKALFDHFVSQLENFLFYYIFTKTPSKELERNFSIWADEVRAIASLAHPDKQGNALNQFIADRFEKNMARKSQELNDALKRLTFDSMQRYRTRYLLARLTQHVQMAFEGQKSRGSLGQYLKLEIEHILPNNPSDELRKSWEDEYSEAIYDEFKNRLGNLTLLEKPINIAAGNDFYSLKRTKYTESGNYLTRSLSALVDVGQNNSIARINKHLCAFENWGAEEIEKRQSLLTELACEIWKTTEI